MPNGQGEFFNGLLAVPIQEWIDMSSGTNSPKRFYRVSLKP